MQEEAAKQAELDARRAEQAALDAYYAELEAQRQADIQAALERQQQRKYQ